MSPKHESCTSSVGTPSASFLADLDRGIAECEQARQRIRPGSVTDLRVADRQRALEAVALIEREHLLIDPAHAAIWRACLGL